MQARAPSHEATFGYEWLRHGALRQGTTAGIKRDFQYGLDWAFYPWPSQGEGRPRDRGAMAILILGGLLTSTVLNLLVLPTRALRYGQFERQSVSVG